MMKRMPISFALWALVTFYQFRESSTFTLGWGIIRPLSSSARQSKRCLLRLSSSSVGRAQNTQPRKDQSENLVVYEKIVRPPPSTVDITFLGSLVSFLQDHWDIPERLPMVYNKQLPDTDESGMSKDHAIVILESPLSSSPDATTLKVEVVAIYPCQKNYQDEISMAMVVVKKHAKAKQLFAALPPMMQNLFADSEKQIVRALDRGLEDFSSGRHDSPQKNQRDKKGREENKMNADWIGELMEDDEIEVQPPPPNRADVVDAEILADPIETTKQKEDSTHKKTPDADSSKKLSEPECGSFKTPSEPHASDDFAVRAARQAAMKQKEEGFAVIAARRAAAQRAEAARNSPKSNRNKPDPSVIEDDNQYGQVDLTNVRPPSLGDDAMGNRAFHQSISLPRKLQSNQGRFRSKQHPKVKSLEKELKPTKKRHDVKDETPITSSARVTEETKPKPSVGSSEDTSSRSSKAKSNPVESNELEGINSVKSTLDEMEKISEEITPEQLLEDVMKFGDASDKKERVGDGFTTGAFEKAKELLREQQRQRDDKLMAKVATKETNKVPGFAPDIKFPEQETQVLSPEEELKRMFEAGEQLADGRIAKWESSGSSLTQAEDATTMEQVDELIAAEKEISSYARVLDDELVELELRLNRSPDEELDGSPRNPQFDIMSGPEVYNPNVDPETVVNWPGALPGTKDTRLPKELREAVVQAQYAAEALSNLSLTEGRDGSKKHFVRKREVTLEQVEKMRQVVADAVEVGLIADPIVVMAERSRLQMVLDELWNQPEERTRDVVMNYKDLLLSDNFVQLIRERLSKMVQRDLDALRVDDSSMGEKHAKERKLLGQLVVHAQLLLKEARALGAELEAQQLEVVRSICKVAMDPMHKTEEETAMALTDAVRDMRPLFDDAFIAYLKYAVEEEEGRLARAGLLDDPEHNRWLFVLKVVQNGVYEELSRGINRYIDHIGYVLRMETAVERRMLLEKLIDAMPTLDVRPFVAVVENIVGALGDSARGEFEDVTVLGEMSNKILQLHKDVKDLLPPERIALKARDADEWAAAKKQKLLEQRQETQKRLAAARDTEEFDEAIDVLGRPGEVERFDGI